MLRDDVSPSREVDFASAVWEARERMSNRLRIVRCAVPLGAKVRSLSSSRIHTHPVEQAWLRDDRLSVCICLGISFPFCEKYNLYVYRGRKLQSTPRDLLHQSLARDVARSCCATNLNRDVSRSANAHDPTKNLWQVNVRLRYCQGVGERPLAPLRRPSRSSITSPQMFSSAIRPGGLDG